MFRFGAIFVLLLIFVLAGAASSEILDDYTDPLPPNPDLPVTQARVLWHGAYCDDVACPPGATVTHNEDLVTQVALPGAHGAGRFVGTGGGPQGTVVLTIDTDLQKLRITAIGILETQSVITYPEAEDAAEFSIDFTANGADALAFEAAGAGIDSTTLVCWLLVSSVNVQYGQMYAQIVEGPGLVIWPFNSFGPEFDFTQIDRVELIIGIYGLEVGMAASADLTFGPIHSITTSTPATPSSWGAIKSRYR